MLKFVILLSVVSCAFGAALPEGMVALPEANGRIMGGLATWINYFPYQISLQRSGFHICGGSIYNSKIIITAAHCLQNVSPSILKVRAGSSFWKGGGVRLNVAAYKNHEGFNVTTLANDIAVMRLSSLLFFSSDVKPIRLATKTPANGAFAVVSGWGATSYGFMYPSYQLRYVDVDILSNSQCASPRYGYGSKIKSGMICTYTRGKDACLLDSGGPLVSGGLLVGVVSWGIGCAYRYYPSVYTDVAAFRSWVITNAGSV